MAVQIPQDTTGAERFRSKLDGLGRAFLTGQNKSGGNLIQPPATPDLSAYNVGGSKGGAVNGGGFGSGAVTAALQSQSQPSPTTPGAGGQQMTYANDYIEQANKLMTQLQQMVTTGFSYNYQSDPNYVAAVQAAKEGAAEASRNTMETMNDRGIFNSSITTSQLGQIEQKAQNEPLKLVPQFEANAYNRFQQGLQNQMGMMNTLYGQGQFQMNYDSNEKWKTEDSRYQEADVTGTYESPQALKLMNDIIGYKEAWGAAGTKQERDNIAAAAVQARASLASMGYNADLFGANVTLDKARKSLGSAGIQTMASKQVDAQNKQTGIQNTQWQKTFDTTNSHWSTDRTDRLAQQKEQNRQTWAQINKPTGGGGGGGGGISSKIISQNTDAMIYKMTKDGVKTLDDAMAWMGKPEHERDILTGVVDPGSIMSHFGKAVTGGSSSTKNQPIDVYYKAVELAKSDPAYKELDSPEQFEALVQKHVNKINSVLNPPKPLTPAQKAQNDVNHKVQWLERMK